MRWGIGIAVAAMLAGAAFWWGRTRMAFSPLAQAGAAYERGDWGGAAAAASQRLKAAPDDGQAQRLLARSLARQGLDAEAQTIYGRLDPNLLHAEDHFLTAKALLRKRQTSMALTELETAHKDAPNHPETLRELARVYAQQDRLEDATSLARHLAEEAGWEAQGELILGLLLSEQNDPAGAAEALGRALRRDPSLRGAPASPAAARKLLARALLESGQPAGARGQLKGVLDAGLDPEASWLLSRAWLQEGSIDKANTALEQSQGYGDDHPQGREPAAYVGAARCAECHRGIHRSQQDSLHSKTFRLASEVGDLRLPDGPVTDPFNARVQHTIRRDGDRLVVETKAEDKDLRALVDYAVGSGDRGLTLVGHDDKGQYRELRLSRYNDGSGWDRTTGHPPHPTEPGAFLGKALPSNGLRRCMSCHTTNPRAVREQVGPEAADRGIGCEMCHGPGGNHVKAVAADFADLAIARPQLATSAQIVKLCGQCHSPRGSEVNRSAPSTVRFQATTLTWSKCYTQSGGTFSCVTCHNPHRDAETSTAFYEAKCLSCHSTEPPPSTRSAGTRPVDLDKLPRRVPCPVNPANDCIRCHMPTVRGAVPHSPFTDHYIRVHREATTAAH